MPAEVREKLGTQQAMLVAALTGEGTAPEGFDPLRFQAARGALTRKRTGAVAKSWPSLARALGENFAPRFATFAERTPPPEFGGALADGRKFARWLAARGELPEGGRVEVLITDLRYALHRNGLIPRRWPTFKWARLAQPRRLLLAFRVPWLGERLFRIPLGL